MGHHYSEIVVGASTNEAKCMFTERRPDDCKLSMGEIQTKSLGEHGTRFFDTSLMSVTSIHNASTKEVFQGTYGVDQTVT